RGRPRRRPLRRTRSARARRAAPGPLDGPRRRRVARALGAAVRRALRVPQARAAHRPRARLMPSWGAVAYGVVLSGLLATIAVAVFLRERRRSVLITAGLSAAAAPLGWDLILRHTGGDFFTDAPISAFPISFEDTGSGVFATALSALLLGFGPLHAASGRRLAVPAAPLRPAAPL